MNEIMIGSLIGITQTIFGHPLDTIKVRIQNKQNWKNMKFTNYYKGSIYPLYGNLLYNMIVFPIHDKTIYQTNSHFLSGLLAGIVVSPLIFIIDIGKIKRQTNTPLKIKDFIFTKDKFINLTCYKKIPKH